MSDQTTMEAVDPQEPAKPNSTSGQGPQSWWQWFFIYPAFGLALISAVPQWADKVFEVANGLTDRSAEEAKQQAALITRSIDCLKDEPSVFETVTGLTVNARFCPQSAAILLRLNSPEDQRFVGIDVASLFERRQAVGFSLVAPAYAASARPVMPDLLHLAQQADDPEARLICLSQPDERTILRHFRWKGQCYDETLDTLTGWVTPAAPVSCRTSCDG